MNCNRTKNRTWILVFGWISILCLIIGLSLEAFRYPNQLLFILIGIFLYNFFELPAILVNQIKTSKSRKAAHFFFILSAFLFNLSLLFVLQNEIVPFIFALVTSIATGIYILWYSLIEFRYSRISFMRFTFIHLYALFLLLMIVQIPVELQAPDYRFRPAVFEPAYPDGNGPTIYVDAAHNNIHTLKDRLIITGKLLSQDGYKVQQLEKKIVTGQELADCQIYLVVNPLHDRNLKVWENPTYPAFTEQEISHIGEWVQDGGSLMLVVDHMPVSGAAYTLAKVFGFELKNGHTHQIPWERDNWFIRDGYSLSDNIITNGFHSEERVDSVLAFGGSSFLYPEDAISILSLDSFYYQWEPDKVWEFLLEDRYSADGYSMGAFKKFGNGKVIVFSEAMMITAQLGGGLSWIKLGMNSKDKPDNYQLLLNSIHWLDSNFNTRK